MCASHIYDLCLVNLHQISNIGRDFTQDTLISNFLRDMRSNNIIQVLQEREQNGVCKRRSM